MLKAISILNHNSSMNVEGLRTEQENLQVVKQEISLMEGIYVSFCALMSWSNWYERRKLNLKLVAEYSRGQMRGK